MASNFDFLKEQFPQLFTHATHTESMAYSAPRASCFYARFTLEQAVLWLYDNDAYLQPPYDNNLGALIHEQTFKDNLKPGLFPKVRAIHKVGNLAAHSSSQITSRDSLHIVEDLFHFLYWLCRFYSPNGKNLPVITFNRQYIPHPETSKDLSREQLTELETQLSQASEMRQIAEKRQQQTEDELNALRQEITTLKQQNEAVADTHDYHEADTRRYLLDILLKEAGWNIKHPDATEFEVQGMPNNSGKEDSNLTANQIRFVENIIDYLTQNGIMNPGLLYEPPFTDIHDEGLDGVFNNEQADEIVTLVRAFNQTVDYSLKETA